MYIIKVSNLIDVMANTNKKSTIVHWIFYPVCIIFFFLVGIGVGSPVHDVDNEGYNYEENEPVLNDELSSSPSVQEPQDVVYEEVDSYDIHTEKSREECKGMADRMDELNLEKLRIRAEDYTEDIFKIHEEYDTIFKQFRYYCRRFIYETTNDGGTQIRFRI